MATFQAYSRWLVPLQELCCLWLPLLIFIKRSILIYLFFHFRTLVLPYILFFMECT